MARRRRKAKKENTEQVNMKRKQDVNSKKQLQPQGTGQTSSQDNTVQGHSSKTQDGEQSTESQATQSQSQEADVVNPTVEGESAEDNLADNASVDLSDVIRQHSRQKGKDGDQKATEEEILEMADSESTTSASTIEFLMDDMEKEESVFNRGRQLSTPTRGVRSVDPSPSSTTSSRNSTPQRGGSRRESLSPTPSGTGSVVNSAFPVRLGITWKAGARVEAMDFIEKWYPARIVEINAPELEVLIHFEGWNARYDEWVPMTSDRLRPLARHSERREGKKGAPKTDYKIGECVFAKWTDCRHYAARIIAINPSGSYEVIFFDGFKKTVQPINVKYMPPEVQVEYGNAGLLPPQPKQLKRRSRDTVKDVTDLSKDSQKDAAKVSKEMRRSFDKAPCPQERKKRCSGQKENLNKKSPKVPVSGDTKPSTSGSKRKRSVGGGSAGKRQKMETGTAEPTGEEASVALATSPPKDKKSSGAAVTSGPGDRVTSNIDPAPDLETKPDLDTDASQALVTNKAKKIPDISSEQTMMKTEVKLEPNTECEQRSQSEVKGEVTAEVTGSVSGVTQPVLPSESEAPVPTVESGLDVAVDTDSSSFSVPTSRRQSYLMAMLQDKLPSYHTSPLTSGHQVKKLTPSPAEGLQAGVHTEGAGTADVTSSNVPLDTLHIRAPKAFKVEEDHNQYKCPFEGCPKAFRKDSLVEYHIKYYHTQDGKPIPPPPPRKRKKTNSVFGFDWKQLLCLKSQKGKKRRHKRSTDSEISVGGRSSTSKRKRRLTEVSLGSLPDTTLDRLQLQIEDSMGSDMLDDPLLGGPIEIDHHEAQVTDDSIALGEEAGPIKKDEEVVNCICQLNDENGLMIQCEVCLCWQHANCMELTEETLPKRYVCYVCTNPPGIRDSARFIYVQDWFREGKLSSFNFLPVPENAEESSARMLGLHDLVGETHNVNRVLDSLRRKIHILQEKNHPEFHFWKKNWDREIEKKRQEAEEAVDKPVDSYSTDVKLEPDETGEGTSQNADGQVILNGADLEATVASLDSPALMEGTVEVTLESGPTVDVQEEVCGEEQEVDAPGEVVPQDTTEEVVLQDPTGEVVLQDPTGEVVLQDPTGEVVLQDPTGEVVLQDPTGEVVLQDPTGEVVLEPTTTEKSVSADKDNMGCDGGAPPSSGLHDYSVNARSAPGSPQQAEGEQEELDSDVAVTPTEEDPIATCEKNLLEHIMNMQDRISERLALIDQHVTAMEELDNMRIPQKDVLADVPVLKKKLHHVINDLVKVKRMSRFH